MAIPQQSPLASKSLNSLADLRAHLERFPHGSFRESALSLMAHVEREARLQSRLLQIANDAAGQLHLDVKYLLFDLEATRRERDGLENYARQLEGWLEEDDGEIDFNGGGE